MDSDEYLALAERMTSAEFEEYLAGGDSGASFWLVYSHAVDQLFPAEPQPLSQQATRRLAIAPIKKRAGNLSSDRVSVGRARNCDICLRAPSVGLLHACIYAELDGTLMIVDSHTHNGTEIDGRRIPAKQPVPLSVGNSITFGSLIVHLVDSNRLYQVLRMQLAKVERQGSYPKREHDTAQPTTSVGSGAAPEPVINQFAARLAFRLREVDTEPQSPPRSPDSSELPLRRNQNCMIFHLHSSRAHSNAEGELMPDPIKLNLYRLVFLSGGTADLIERSPDGQMLAVAVGTDINLYFEKGDVLLCIQSSFEGPVQGLAFSPDSKLLAFCTSRAVRLLPTADAQNLRTLSREQVTEQRVTFSSDGKLLASVGVGNTVDVWQVHSGQKLRSLRGHTDRVSSVAFSSDGLTLASASWDGSARLWQADTGQCIRILLGEFKNPITRVSWSPSGSLVAATSTRRVQLWLTNSGRLWRTFTGHESSVLSTAFSPDGRLLVSIDQGQIVRFWQMSSRSSLGAFKCIDYAPKSIAFNSLGTALYC